MKLLTIKLSLQVYKFQLLDDSVILVNSEEFLQVDTVDVSILSKKLQYSFGLPLKSPVADNFTLSGSAL